MKIKKKGGVLLKNSFLNKDTAFSASERRVFDLDGLLPPHIETIEQQVSRAYSSYQSKQSEIEKHIFLRSLQDRNETLFFRLVREHIKEMMPIIYTPVVGEACEKFSQIYRQPRGLFISYPMKDRIDELFNNVPGDRNIKVIVVTDGERILGLGDQGVDGMGIPIGKLSLYTACGGIEPSHTLPIVLDVGTNNVERRNHPEYIGLRSPRITGQEYDDFLDKFVAGVQKRFPGALLQFEDFAQAHAMPLLKRYRNQLCTFNDDIQGTAAVCVATLLSATKVLKQKLSEQIIVVVGGGSAGCGISEMLVLAMQKEGLSREEALKRFFIIDRYGLLDDSMQLLDFQKPFAKSQADIKHLSRDVQGHINLTHVVSDAHPTILLGVSGQPGLFTQEVIETMHQHCNHPIVLPLSNPTSCCEAHPKEVLEWTKGEAIVATGSPFSPVEYQGKTHIIAQSNNAYIFPGLGLGVVASKARFVSDEMLMAASIALSELSPAINDDVAPLLPSLEDITSVSKHIARAVIASAISGGHADKMSDTDINKAIEETFWQPEYQAYTPILS